MWQSKTFRHLAHLPLSFANQRAQALHEIIMDERRKQRDLIWIEFTHQMLDRC